MSRQALAASSMHKSGEALRSCPANEVKGFGAKFSPRRALGVLCAPLAPERLPEARERADVLAARDAGHEKGNDPEERKEEKTNMQLVVFFVWEFLGSLPNCLLSTSKCYGNMASVMFHVDRVRGQMLVNFSLWA